MIFSNFDNVLEIKLCIGKIYIFFIREKGKSKHRDSLNTGLPAAIAYSRHIVKISNSLGWVKSKEIGHILLYFYTISMAVEFLQIGRDEFK